LNKRESVFVLWVFFLLFFSVFTFFYVDASQQLGRLMLHETRFDLELGPKHHQNIN